MTSDPKPLGFIKSEMKSMHFLASSCSARFNLPTLVPRFDWFEMSPKIFLAPSELRNPRQPRKQPPRTRHLHLYPHSLTFSRRGWLKVITFHLSNTRYPLPPHPTPVRIIKNTDYPKATPNTLRSSIFTPLATSVWKQKKKKKKFCRGYSENDRGEVRTGIGGIQSISGPETIGCNVIVFTCTADDTILESWSADERKECTIWVLWGVLAREGVSTPSMDHLAHPLVLIHCLLS
ncbi:hypothetical protein CEXT_706731 [Caerostris extrusa]|uniref:Uncharacterized protein n=1 Tax=Caerostris extrusa TaxID=172846 RepID=A0AAV4PXF0_CAEEX|nr:hypothetical protein CEXT_706731 [Caerostris extrusa]